MRAPGNALQSDGRTRQPITLLHKIPKKKEEYLFYCTHVRGGRAGTKNFHNPGPTMLVPSGGHGADCNHVETHMWTHKQGNDPKLKPLSKNLRASSINWETIPSLVSND